MFKTSIKAIICLIFLINIATAQKLPGKQEVSLKAPVNSKVDGKATEWDNKFQAYNNATEFFYTLSNSETELYLTVYCVQPSVIRRIMNGGLSLTINKSGKKSDPAPIVVTYPIFDAGTRFTPMFRPMVIATGQPRLAAPVMISDVATVRGGVSFSAVGGGGGERPLTEPISDSLLAINNKNIAAKAKNIGITGVKGLDSLISVYNTDGIRTVGQFDNKMGYTYELSISLKNLGLSAGDAAKFAYQLKINEVAQKGITIVGGDGSNPSQIKSITVSAGATMGQPATDFWGEYILQK